MEMYNNLTRGGMRSKKVNFSPFGVIFNLKLTQFNIISPRASDRCKVNSQAGYRWKREHLWSSFVSIVGRIICPVATCFDLM